MINYKGYIGLLRVDEEAGVLRGKVVNTRDTITFQGKTIDEATRAFHGSVDDYLEFCESLGETPEKPFSGKFVVRIGPALHRKLSIIAQAEGISLNKLVQQQFKRLARRSFSRLSLIPTQAAAEKPAKKPKQAKPAGKKVKTSAE